MGKYQQDAQQLLEAVGGKENIAAVSHCVTRMRFVLNDPAKADVPRIEKIKSVKGTFTQAGQFQVIIGNTVSDFYNDFTAVSGLEGVSKEAVKSAAKQNQNRLQKIMTALAEIFAPLIPAIITGGLILGFRNCIDSLYLFEDGTKTLCDISQFWSGVDSFLWLIGEAVFHMLPVGICWSVTKKMGSTQILGIILGLTLVSGQLLNAYSVATTPAADIPKWDFGFVQVNMIGYQAQVIPAILAAFTLVYLEKFFRKICPSVVSMIVVPFCSLLLAVMAAHFVLGPIGWAIGSAISSVVYAGISGSFRVVFGAKGSQVIKGQNRYAAHRFPEQVGVDVEHADQPVAVGIAADETGNSGTQMSGADQDGGQAFAVAEKQFADLGAQHIDFIADPLLPEAAETVEILPYLAGGGAHHVGKFAGRDLVPPVGGQIGKIAVIFGQPFDDRQRYFVLYCHGSIPRNRESIPAAGVAPPRRITDL